MARINSSFSGALLTRAMGILLVVCLAECAAGVDLRNSGSTIDKGRIRLDERTWSCLSYGHSCWGGHGKRSPGRVMHQNAPSVQDYRRYLSRLLHLDLNKPLEMPAAPFAFNRPSLDASNENDLYPNRRGFRENADLSDERRDFNIGKFSLSENPENQLLEDKAPFDSKYIEDSQPLEKDILYNILK